MNPTEEQSAILKVVKDKDEDLVVNALAGSGKTSTLLMVTEQNPDKRFLYLAFNKSVVKEAEEKFPSNCKIYTVHGLAYRSYVSTITNKKAFNSKLAKTWKLRDYIKNFDLKDIEGLLPPEEDFYMTCNIVKRLVTRFKNSDAGSITPDSIPPSERMKSFSPSLQAMLYDKANQIWESEIDMASKTPLDHGTYLKLWQLSDPVINGYDFILVDEAQDSNPTMLSIITNQTHVRKIFVGDTWQSIYAFTNAINAMNSINNADRLYLTQSWRFGNVIATEANRILKVLSRNGKPIRGTSTVDSSIGLIDETKPYAIICRTNAAIALRAMQLLAEDKRVYVEGGVDELCADLLALYLLSIGERASFPSKYRPFGTFAGAREESKVDVSIRRDLAFVNKFGGEIPEILEELKARVLKNAKKAQVTLTSAHKSKGLQWSQVRLNNDFKFTILPNPINGSFTEDQELNLLYVAVTRAMHRLETNEAYETYLNTLKELTENA